MLTSFVISWDVISFFETRKCQKIEKIEKNRWKYSYLLDDLRSFNENCKKDVTYDNIKSQKNQSFTISLEDTFLKKPQGGDQIKLPPPAVLGLIYYCPVFSFNTLWKLQKTYNTGH